jgi:PAS domain S-box-containing protein
VLASLPEAVIVSDALGLIHYLNPATEEMLDCSAAELAGKMIEEGVPLLFYSSPEQSELSFRRALQSSSRGSAILLDRQSRQLRVDVSTAPVIDQNCGFVIGAVTILRRISD